MGRAVKTNSKLYDERGKKAKNILEYKQKLKYT
jgi:hypothetical protein